MWLFPLMCRFDDNEGIWKSVEGACSGLGGRGYAYCHQMLRIYNASAFQVLSVSMQANQLDESRQGTASSLPGAIAHE